MAVTMIKDLARSVREAKLTTTIDNLADGPGKYYRHPDSVHISYPLTVNEGKTIGSLPTGELNVAIVGGGASGVCSLYELSRMATADSPINVTIFENDPNNFLFRAKNVVDPDGISRRNAGRVSSYKASDTVYEIGAMRFPEIAGLTWHYARLLFGGNSIVKPFANPGQVPTEFVFGSQFDRYVGGVWLDENSPTRIVRDLVVRGFVGGAANDDVIYPIGGQKAGSVIGQLRDENTTEEQLEAIKEGWNAFIEQHDGTTLAGAVRHILTTYKNALPTIDGLDPSEPETLNWCVELFGRFGFGTGGFKPLFNMSLVEMMRLILWDYSNEYTFPSDQAPENVDFIEGLYNKARENEHLTITLVKGRVSDAYHISSPAIGASIAYYLSDGGPEINITSFDYAILALPHDLIAKITNRTGYARAFIVNNIGDVGHASSPFQVSPALRLTSTISADTGSWAPNARLVTALSSLHMTRSSKIFATITAANATGPEVPEFPSEPTGEVAPAPISAIVSDSGLAATYMVPSTIDGKENEFKSFLISYTWDDDSTKIENTFANWPESSPETSSGTNTFNQLLNLTYRVDPSPQGGVPSKWWLSTVLQTVDVRQQVTYDWTTYKTAGGFKLDMTGDYPQSNLCFRFYTHAKNSEVDNRFFITGCSVSHLGGWLEGAFMTAINAVSGIVVAANGGGFFGVEALNEEARKLFNTMTPVA